MIKKVEFYLTLLRNAGHRITEQRQLICEYLAQTDQHPTPYQVYTDIHGRHPEISRATIYNTLNALQQLGAIVEINFGANHTHYETDPSPHVNLICLRCHQVVDYHSEAASAVRCPPTDPGLSSSGHQGRCYWSLSRVSTSRRRQLGRVVTLSQA
jgi:Fur family peroxide stress response transcriptional regulator